MSKNCSIMKRMKENYETRSRTYLTRRMPVIMRIDGKAFHTYTRGLDKPFDEGLIEDMTETAKYLCSQIQGAKCAYVQSDEISILITDYDKLETNAWFDYQVQKMCSVSASLSASKFNQLRYIRHCLMGSEIFGNGIDSGTIERLPLADFDCRVFNIPREEVANYFLARQKDAVKNSISMLAQSLYSQPQLHKKNQSDMQEMCFQKGINWNDLDYSKKRGTFVVKNEYWNDELVVYLTQTGGWATDNIFTHDPNRINFASNTGDVKVIPREDIKIRSIWESVETPMKFNESDFRQWIYQQE